jgi:hypothetical protein
MIIILIAATVLLILSGYVISNLLKKVEKLETFIAAISDNIQSANDRLKEIDEKGTFSSDDEIGWFFENIKEIQETLNGFNK